jgi:hypothetical protein
MPMYVYSYKHIHAAPESIDDPRRYPEDLIYPDVVRSAAVNVIATCQRMPYGPEPDKLVKSIARVKN